MSDHENSGGAADGLESSRSAPPADHRREVEAMIGGHIGTDREAVEGWRLDLAKIVHRQDTGGRERVFVAVTVRRRSEARHRLMVIDRRRSGPPIVLHIHANDFARWQFVLHRVFEVTEAADPLASEVEP